MFMNAGRSGRAAAGADGDLASFEVTEELGPFIVGGDAVLLGGTQCATAGEERKVGLDGFVGVDGLVAEGDVDVAMPGDDLRDVRRQAAHDGVGDENPAEVVRCEAQRAALTVGEAGVGESGSEELRTAPSDILRCSPPNRRWNSHGVGACHTHSRRS